MHKGFVFYYFYILNCQSGCFWCNDRISTLTSEASYCFQYRGMTDGILYAANISFLVVIVPRFRVSIFEPCGCKCVKKAHVWYLIRSEAKMALAVKRNVKILKED